MGFMVYDDRNSAIVTGNGGSQAGLDPFDPEPKQSGWNRNPAGRLLVPAMQTEQVTLPGASVIGAPVMPGLNGTIGRRRGARIKAKGIDRDAVGSHHAHIVQAGGSRWLSLMLPALNSSSAGSRTSAFWTVGLYAPTEKKIDIPLIYIHKHFSCDSPRCVAR